MPLLAPLAPAPFSFHCTICFEPFDSDERPPVILPCGHTFICEQCSKRLKRCMECRTSLFLTVSPPVPPVTPMPKLPSGAGRLNSPMRVAKPVPKTSSKSRPVAKEQIALPLPKNVLLLSLMETAEREARAKKASILHKCNNSEDESRCDSSLETSNDGDFDDDDHRVKTSMAAISSACGTYAVADPAGLTVLPKKPDDQTTCLGRRLASAPRESPPSTAETKTVVSSTEQASEEDEEENDQQTSSSSHIQNYLNPPLPHELKHGERVQVVTIEDGWVQLARNMGFVNVTSRQLVKVGGPTDKACEIEAMLMNVDETREELDLKRKELNRIGTGLEQELRDALLQPPEPRKPNYELDLKEEKENNAPVPQQNSEMVTIQKDDYQAKPDEKSTTVTMSPERNQQKRETLRTPSPQNEHVSPLSMNAHVPVPSQSQHKNLHIPELFHSATLDSFHSSVSSISSDRTHVKPAKKNFERQHSDPTKISTSPTGAIDFRTGLSGHCALLSSRSRAPHPRPGARAGGRMLISAHRGVGGALNGAKKVPYGGN